MVWQSCTNNIYVIFFILFIIIILNNFLLLSDYLLSLFFFSFFLFFCYHLSKIKREKFSPQSRHFGTISLENRCEMPEHKQEADWQTDWQSDWQSKNNQHRVGKNNLKHDQEHIFVGHPKMENFIIASQKTMKIYLYYRATNCGHSFQFNFVLICTESNRRPNFSQQLFALAAFWKDVTCHTNSQFSRSK